jgi:hypothetical protein
MRRSASHVIWRCAGALFSRRGDRYGYLKGGPLQWSVSSSMLSLTLQQIPGEEAMTIKPPASRATAAQQRSSEVREVAADARKELLLRRARGVGRDTARGRGARPYRRLQDLVSTALCAPRVRGSAPPDPFNHAWPQARLAQGSPASTLALVANDNRLGFVVDCLCRQHIGVCMRACSAAGVHQ